MTKKKVCFIKIRVSRCSDSPKKRELKGCSTKKMTWEEWLDIMLEKAYQRFKELEQEKEDNE